MDTADAMDIGVWRPAADQLGLQGIAIAEEYGGAGFSFAEQAIVLEELGAPCTPGLTWPAPCWPRPRCWPARMRAPGATCCPASRRDEGRHAGVHRGRRILGRNSVRLAAAKNGHGWRLDGHKSFVLDGHGADLILAVAATDADRRPALSLFAVDGTAAGLSRRVLPTLDQTRRLARCEFSDVPARLIGSPGAGRAALEHTLDVAAIALAAEQLGGAQRALDMAVGYAKVRQQFGRAIGSFQAIKHRCADLLLEVESLRSAVGYAAAAVAEGSGEVPVLASLVKAYASEVYSRVAAENIQIHGGIGFTWEHDAHLYLKRAKASELFLGDGSYHRERLATRIGL